MVEPGYIRPLSGTQLGIRRSKERKGKTEEPETRQRSDALGLRHHRMQIHLADRALCYPAVARKQIRTVPWPCAPVSSACRLCAATDAACRFTYRFIRQGPRTQPPEAMQAVRSSYKRASPAYVGLVQII